MGDPADTARAAGQRLAPQFGQHLVTDVEVALHDLEVGPARRPEQYLDPTSLGELIVSIATFAWIVYNDLRTRSPTPDPDVVARNVRVEIGIPDETTVAERDRIIEIVVEETVRAANDQG